MVNRVRLDMTMNSRVSDAGSIVYSNDDKKKGCRAGPTTTYKPSDSGRKDVIKLVSLTIATLVLYVALRCSEVKLLVSEILAVVRPPALLWLRKAMRIHLANPRYNFLLHPYQRLAKATRI